MGNLTSPHDFPSLIGPKVRQVKRASPAAVPNTCEHWVTNLQPNQSQHVSAQHPSTAGHTTGEPQLHQPIGALSLHSLRDRTRKLIHRPITFRRRPIGRVIASDRCIPMVMVYTGNVVAWSEIPTGIRTIVRCSTSTSVRMPSVIYTFFSLHWQPLAVWHLAKFLSSLRSKVFKVNKRIYSCRDGAFPQFSSSVSDRTTARRAYYYVVLLLLLVLLVIHGHTTSSILPMSLNLSQKFKLT